jgi:hypothetical protein
MSESDENVDEERGDGKDEAFDVWKTNTREEEGRRRKVHGETYGRGKGKT